MNLEIFQDDIKLLLAKNTRGDNSCLRLCSKKQLRGQGPNFCRHPILGSLDWRFQWRSQILLVEQIGATISNRVKYPY